MVDQQRLDRVLSRVITLRLASHRGKQQRRIHRSNYKDDSSSQSDTTRWPTTGASSRRRSPPCPGHAPARELARRLLAEVLAEQADRVEIARRPVTR